MMRFPDVEALLIDFLRSLADVGTKVPNPRPAKFLRVQRVGGTSANRVIDRPMVLVEAWADDSAVASDLAELARGMLLHEHTRMPLVRSVTEVGGPYSAPDPESETPRYRFTMQLTVRATRV